MGMGSSPMASGSLNQRSAISWLTSGVATDTSSRAKVMAGSASRHQWAALSNNSPSVLISSHAPPSMMYSAGSVSEINSENARLIVLPVRPVI